MSELAANYLITSKELRKILETDSAKGEKTIVLLDVREPEEFEESRIEGCTLIPLGELGFRAQRELNPESDIIVYCAHGVRSMHAVMALRQMGFEKTRSLVGGIASWFEQN